MHKFIIATALVLSALVAFPLIASANENGSYKANLALSTIDGCSQSTLTVDLDEHAPTIRLEMQDTCLGIYLSGTALLTNIDLTKTSLSAHTLVTFYNGGQSFRAMIWVQTSLVRFASEERPNGDILSAAQVESYASVALVVAPHSLLFTELHGEGTILYQHLTGNPLPE